jgi:hypothetical protein
MSSPPPLDYAAPTFHRDYEHLQILKICHYIMAGLAAFFGCIPIIHITIGTLIVTGRIPMQGPNAPPPAFGYFFIVMGSIAVLLCWAWAIILFVSARFLGRHKHRTFSFVVAIISCIQIPFGTVLGIFTIIVLCRPSTNLLYESQPPLKPASSLPPV